MSDERFILKEYKYDWWFVFDKQQEYTGHEDNVPFEVDGVMLVPMSEVEVVTILNEFEKKNKLLSNLFEGLE